ncbi:hypothetical protein BGW37DRAFT_462946 [Umbelopsis sp. PMI_123]|nr:hypothetical protein BGW37DRAFT_462946 [Umbelopsis sp. PMI_123]
MCASTGEHGYSYNERTQKLNRHRVMPELSQQYCDQISMLLLWKVDSSSAVALCPIGFRGGNESNLSSGTSLFTLEEQRKIENVVSWNIILSIQYEQLYCRYSRARHAFKLRDSSSSIDFDMVDFGSSDELAHSYQVADMEVENERMVF